MKKTGSRVSVRNRERASQVRNPSCRLAARGPAASDKDLGRYLRKDRAEEERVSNLDYVRSFEETGHDVVRLGHQSQCIGTGRFRKREGGETRGDSLFRGRFVPRQAPPAPTCWNISEARKKKGETSTRERLHEKDHQKVESRSPCEGIVLGDPRARRSEGGDRGKEGTDK